MLQEKYYVLSISFQGAGNLVFSTEQRFVNYLTGAFAHWMTAASWPQELIQIVQDRSLFGGRWHEEPFSCLAMLIHRLCSAADRGIVLMIDEADRTAVNEVLLQFLAMLRETRLAELAGQAASFQSVILAGVIDIWNLQDKLRSDDNQAHAGSWTFAADCNVDLSFSAGEIAGMLQEYKEDHPQAEMDIAAVSQELRRLTSGYPVIVSWLCQWLDESGCQSWTAESVQAAGNAFLRSGCVLLHSVLGELQRHSNLQDIVSQLLFCGGEYPYDPPQPGVRRGILAGILRKGGNNRAVLSNPLYKEYLSIYIVDFMRDKRRRSSRG